MRGAAKTPESRYCPDEAATQAVGAELVRGLGPGDVVLLEGELGAGKTTLVKGALAALGHQGVVRSPTFNLVQTFETTPPVVHADLYRVPSASGLDLEEYLDTHLAFIEWAGRAGELVSPDRCWVVRLEFSGQGRQVTIVPPDPS